MNILFTIIVSINLLCWKLSLKWLTNFVHVVPPHLAPMSFWWVSLDPHLATRHSNICIHLRWVTILASSTLHLEMQAINIQYVEVLSIHVLKGWIYFRCLLIVWLHWTCNSMWHSNFCVMLISVVFVTCHVPGT